MYFVTAIFKVLLGTLSKYTSSIIWVPVPVPARSTANFLARHRAQYSEGEGAYIGSYYTDTGKWPPALSNRSNFRNISVPFFQGDPRDTQDLRTRTALIPVKDSHTRIWPLALATGHGRYITVTPEHGIPHPYCMYTVRVPHIGIIEITAGVFCTGTGTALSPLCLWRGLKRSALDLGNRIRVL
jgi:hypothetical protein